MRRLLLTLVAAACLQAAAGLPPPYRYGEQWWQEYRNDTGTELLLHAGPPQVSGRAQLKAAIAAKHQEEQLIDLAELDAKDEPIIKPEAMGPKPVDEAAAPLTVILDYSNQRRRLSLPDGFARQPGAGRFGGGLVCSGGSLKVPVGNIESVETWMKVDAIPAAESCLFAIDDDMARLLLRPDGKLELRLKNPHGIFDAQKTPEAAQVAILQRPADIVAPQPLTPGEWTHVIIRKVRHPMPGGGEPWEVRLVINGDSVAGYQSERFNRGGNCFGGRQARLTIAGNAAGGEPFHGVLDEIRVCTNERVFYERPVLAWRDPAAARELQFDRPWFRNDATALHVGFDRGLAADRGPAGAAFHLPLKDQPVAGLLTEGIRGKALIVDPTIGLPRLPLEGTGISGSGGAVECWLRPLNWDDVTGYWHHTPPKVKTLSVLRLFARNPATGEEERWLDLGLDRAFNLERARVPIDPGHWLHLTVVWDRADDGAFKSWVWIDGERAQGVWHAKAKNLADWTPTAIEVGIDTPVTVKNDEPPRILIDELVAYKAPLAQDEAKQALARWQGRLEPLPLYRFSTSYKYSLGKLECSLQPLLPPGETAATARVACTDADGQPLTPALDLGAPGEDGVFRGVLANGLRVPPGTYTFAFSAADAAGKELLKGTREWTYAEEPWRNCAAGVLDQPPPPWTPLKRDGATLSTRMTTYRLAPDGLPAAILADGVDLLAGPVRLFAGGQPMTGAPLTPGDASAVAADWQGRFTGDGISVGLACHAEYDGMIRFELRPAAGELPSLRLDIPLKPELATRALWYPVGARGVRVGAVPDGEGRLLSTKPAGKDGYGFWAHCDLNDRNRGLWWFCDNAAGWAQSPTVPAIEIVREGGAVILRLNLIAEATADRPDYPIVFAILPHPARPLPEKYRLYERVSSAVDGPDSSVFDAFMPWPIDPRPHSMKLYPAADPAHPGDGPSWAYAESCIPSMKAAKPVGYRTMYLSRAWFSCRAGAYDGWEWRSGKMHAASLTHYFVNYLCWEMNEWLGRGIFDAVYLDECYETPVTNLEAGMSVRLPDGSEQPGCNNFAFRELMQRWRGIFVQHGLTPMLLAHHTYSFQYPGLVYCEAILDGENYPIVSLNSKDWIDSVPLVKYEVTQSPRMWGVTPFWMPYVAEGGFAEKEKSQFPKWQWRMARQAQSVFAHFEIATVYECQGAQVYKAYWKDVLGWGAGDPAVTFTPYWQAAPAVQVDGQGKDALVSWYRQGNKLLMIVSNRLPKEREITIKLDRAALGLPASATVAVLDSGAAPPLGDDYHKDKPAGPRPGEGTGLPGAEEPLGIQLDDDATLAARRQEAFSPRLEGDTLVVPVHARDFRLLTLE